MFDKIVINEEKIKNELETQIKKIVFNQIVYRWNLPFLDENTTFDEWFNSLTRKHFDEGELPILSEIPLSTIKETFKDELKEMFDDKWKSGN